jgi:hypothetical protein
LIVASKGFGHSLEFLPLVIKPSNGPSNVVARPLVVHWRRAIAMGVTVKRMNRAARFAVAIGVGLTAVEAQAGSVTVTFGDLPNEVQIQNYYNGGLSGPPIRGPGPDLGLVFSSLANEQKATTTNPPPRPGTGKFENNPSGAAGVLYFPYSPTTDSYIDDAAGFTSLTFAYSLLDNALPPSTTYKVDLYSGLNGTGTLLGSVDLTPSATPIACLRSFDEFCSWSFASIFTGGTYAESAVFNTPGVVLNAEFDKMTFATPEPQTWAMLLIGFAGLGLLRLKSLPRFAVRFSRT